MVYSSRRTRKTFQRTPGSTFLDVESQSHAKKDANGSFSGGTSSPVFEKRKDTVTVLSFSDSFFYSVGNAAKRVESGLGLKPFIPGIVSHSLRLFFLSIILFSSVIIILLRSVLVFFSYFLLCNIISSSLRSVPRPVVFYPAHTSYSLRYTRSKSLRLMAFYV